jgi:hypothetical protein
LRVSVLSKLDSHELTAETATSSSNYAWDITPREHRQSEGTIDFDAAIRDPNAPARMLAAYDSGDHLHPNDQGWQVMANTIDLSLSR